MFDAVQDALQAVQSARSKTIKAAMLASAAGRNPELWETLIMLENTLRLSEHFGRRAHSITQEEAAAASHPPAAPAGGKNEP